MPPKKKPTKRKMVAWTCDVCGHGQTCLEPIEGDVPTCVTPGCTGKFPATVKEEKPGR
jgi:hypothetical protein